MADEFKIEWRGTESGAKAVIGMFALYCSRYSDGYHSTVESPGSGSVHWFAPSPYATAVMAQSMAEKNARRIAREMLWLAGGVK